MRCGECVPFAQPLKRDANVLLPRMCLHGGSRRNSGSSRLLDTSLPKQNLIVNDESHRSISSWSFVAAQTTAAARWQAVSAAATLLLVISSPGSLRMAISREEPLVRKVFTVICTPATAKIHFYPHVEQ